MRKHEEQYIADLRRHAAETRALLSNPQKQERERMVVRAFLRCVGEKFSGSEIRSCNQEPVDVAFRSARFQVRDSLGDRKRGLEWREHEIEYQKAQRVSDLVKPWVESVPMSYDEAARLAAEGLAEKAAKYGVRTCLELDALVYVDHSNRHLWPLTPNLNAEVACELSRHGWRSVSMLFLPYGVVLVAQRHAPQFLQNKVGHILNQWPHCYGWFDA